MTKFFYPRARVYQIFDVLIMLILTTTKNSRTLQNASFARLRWFAPAALNAPFAWLAPPALKRFWHPWISHSTWNEQIFRKVVVLNFLEKKILLTRKKSLHTKLLPPKLICFKNYSLLNISKKKSQKKKTEIKRLKWWPTWKSIWQLSQWFKIYY